MHFFFRLIPEDRDIFVLTKMPSGLLANDDLLEKKNILPKKCGLCPQSSQSIRENELDSFLACTQKGINNTFRAFCDIELTREQRRELLFADYQISYAVISASMFFILCTFTK